MRLFSQFKPPYSIFNQMIGENKHLNLNLVSLYSTHKSKNDIKSLYERYNYKEYPTQTSPLVYRSIIEYDSDKDNKEIQDSLKIIIQSEFKEETDIQTPNLSTFNQELYFKRLKTELFGRDLLTGNTLSSTQTLTLKYLELSEEQGFVMIADRQLAGKGRGTNNWESPLGGLLYTFKCKLSNGKLLPFLQYLAGVAMIRSIHALPEASEIVKNRIQLKWPNDIYADGLKIGGILCQSNYFGSTFDVAIGIGINVSNDKPTTSINQLIPNNSKENKEFITREMILSSFFNQFESMYIQFLRNGFKSFESEYLSYWLHQDQVVLLKEENQFIKIIGLTDEGYLKAIETNKDGETFPHSKIHSLYPDGNSFDFQNSLILPKKTIPS